MMAETSVDWTQIILAIFGVLVPLITAIGLILRQRSEARKELVIASAKAAKEQAEANKIEAESQIALLKAKGEAELYIQKSIFDNAKGLMAESNKRADELEAEITEMKHDMKALEARAEKSENEYKVLVSYAKKVITDLKELTSNPILPGCEDIMKPIVELVNKIITDSKDMD